MNGRDRKKCRLCLKTVYNNDEMKEITRPMLEAALFLHLNLEDNGALMCIECSRNLQNAYDFKSTCVNIVKKILPSVNPDENMKLNENNFRHDKNIKLIDGSEDQKVCRFCMKVTESGYFTFLQEKKEHIFIVDMVQKYIPELNLNDTEEIATCEICLIALQSLLNFISVCLDVKEKTENMDKTVKSQLKLNNIKVVDLKHEVNDTNIAMEEKYKCGEDITVKEEDVLELDNSEVLIKNKTEKLGGADCLDVEEKTQDMNEAVESRLELNDVKEFKLKHELNYNIAMEDIYNECEDDITVKDETSLKLDNSELPIEDSETESFQDTGLASRDISEAKVYKCEKCSYETKRKYHLTQHMLLHENFSGKTLYKCGTCLFHTKFERCLKRHMLLHKDPSDVAVYECETCSYQTTFKYRLKGHMRIHQDPLDITMYECEKCSFKTKHKSYLKMHVLIHQDVSLYKCEKCSYQTKFKYTMKKHLQIHKSSPDGAEYKCEGCSYQTRYKQHMKRHLLRHKKFSDVAIYKCGTCSYQTKFKGHLKTHMLVHQDVTIFVCEMCSFQSKFKRSLKRHMMIHQNDSDVTIYKCEKCSYQSKYKDTLKRHLLTHQDLSDVAVYKCTTCSFQTRHKGSLKLHMPIHQKLSDAKYFCGNSIEVANLFTLYDI